MNNNIYFTKGIHSECKKDPSFFIKILKFIDKFSNNDWGDTCKEDCELNKEALKTNERIVALYKIEKEKIFIIKERNNGITTVLFGNEY